MGRLFLRRAGIFLATCILFLCIDYFGYPYGTALRGRSFNIGRNGLWLRYTWYFGQHSNSDVETLRNGATNEGDVRFLSMRTHGKDASA
jgi:hypothetical protein